nr:12828_t:CDS:2 [Entrophospora candida]
MSTKSNSPDSNDNKYDSSNQIVLWKYDNPYANYKSDLERLFIIGDCTVKITQKLSEKIDISQNTGNVVWDGAYILSKFIINNLSMHNDKVDNKVDNGRQISFIELGSGCGLVGLSAWISGGKVICTDLPGESINHTKLNIQKNVARILDEQEINKNNEKMILLRKEDISTHELDWTNLPNNNSSNINNYDNKLKSKTFDIILASEIFYLPETWIDMDFLKHEFNSKALLEYKMFWLTISSSHRQIN